MATNNNYYIDDFLNEEEDDDDENDNDFELEDDEDDDDDDDDFDYSMDSTSGESTDENSKINRFNSLIDKLINDKQNKLNYQELLENIQNILSSNKSIFKDQDGNYKKDIVINSYRLLDFILLENNEMFSRENCYYSLYFISYYFIPVMGNSLLDYMDKMAPFIYAALDSDPNDDYDVHGIAIETIDVLFSKYKEALLPYCDSIIGILIKSYAKMNPTDPMIYYLCDSLYRIYKKIGKNFIKWTSSVLEIIDQVSNTVFLKQNTNNNNNMDTDTDDETNCEDDELRSICLNFYNRTCDIDILLIHARKYIIIDYLNHNQGDTSESCLLIAKLRLIKNLLKYVNFEIYMLLDKENINQIIKIGKQSQIGKVKNLAECIHSKIEKYKGNLRKFYVLNGYAKKLN